MKKSKELETPEEHVETALDYQYDAAMRRLHRALSTLHAFHVVEGALDGTHIAPLEVLCDAINMWASCLPTASSEELKAVVEAATAGVLHKRAERMAQDKGTKEDMQ